MRDEDSLMNPPFEELLEKIPGKYSLVLTATKRAKQIIRQHRLNPMGVEEADRHRKPLSIALYEIADGKVDQKTLYEQEVVFDDYIEDDLTMFDEERREDMPEPPIPETVAPEAEADESIDLPKELDIKSDSDELDLELESDELDIDLESDD